MDGYMVRMNHGGFCCGITHIHGFGFAPERKCPARSRKTPKDFQQAQLDNPSYVFLTNDACPAETHKERLIRLIDYTTNGEFTDMNGRSVLVQRGRPSGIIEVVLAGMNQKRDWHDTLLELGFRFVTEQRNSNSGNLLSVYHLSTGVPYVAPAPIGGTNAPA